jgi:hypothetical protein
MTVTSLSGAARVVAAESQASLRSCGHRLQRAKVWHTFALPRHGHPCLPPVLLSVDRSNTLRLAVSERPSKARRAALVQGRRCDDHDASAAVSFRESVPRSFGRRWILADRSQQKASHTRRTVFVFSCHGARRYLRVLTSERRRANPPQRFHGVLRRAQLFSTKQDAQARGARHHARAYAGRCYGALRPDLRPWYHGRFFLEGARNRVARERPYRLA